MIMRRADAICSIPRRVLRSPASLACPRPLGMPRMARCLAFRRKSALHAFSRLPDSAPVPSSRRSRSCADCPCRESRTGTPCPAVSPARSRSGGPERIPQRRLIAGMPDQHALPTLVRAQGPPPGDDLVSLGLPRREIGAGIAIQSLPASEPDRANRRQTRWAGDSDSERMPRIRTRLQATGQDTSALRLEPAANSRASHWRLSDAHRIAALGIQHPAIRGLPRTPCLCELTCKLGSSATGGCRVRTIAPRNGCALIEISDHEDAVLSPTRLLARTHRVFHRPVLARHVDGSTEPATTGGDGAPSGLPLRARQGRRLRITRSAVIDVRRHARRITAGGVCLRAIVQWHLRRRMNRS